MTYVLKQPINLNMIHILLLHDTMKWCQKVLQWRQLFIFHVSSCFSGHRTWRAIYKINQAKRKDVFRTMWNIYDEAFYENSEWLKAKPLAIFTKYSVFWTRLYEDKTLKKLYDPFGINWNKARATSRRQFTFYHSVPRSSRYTIDRPRKSERLGWPWSYPVVLKPGTLDWESSALTTRAISNINLQLAGTKFGNEV